jgi:hypothetical protein
MENVSRAEKGLLGWRDYLRNLAAMLLFTPKLERPRKNTFACRWFVIEPNLNVLSPASGTKC